MLPQNVYDKHELGELPTYLELATLVDSATVHADSCALRVDELVHQVEA